MCHTSCIIFAAKVLSKEDIEGKRVLEIGSYDQNGSLRTVVMARNPSQYIGIDLEMGPGVDEICRAEQILSRYGPESFDLIIATEIIEHVYHWRKAISNMKSVCAPNGAILITTRSKGFPYHAAPYDFWRYETEDMKNIFSDFNITVLEEDPQYSGVFMKAVKTKAPAGINHLGDYKLFSMVTGRKESSLSNQDFHCSYYRRTILRLRIKKIADRLLRIVARVFGI